MNVPYFRLEITDAERAAVDRILRSGWLTTGMETRLFEEEFADSIGCGVEAIAVNSNTAGMHLALEAMGIAPGDEVIVPSLTFTATAEVVRYLGADPVFAEIDPRTRCLDPDRVAEKIGPRTKAIIPVHFGGLAADMGRLHDIAEAHGLEILEDAAHAFPATYGGRPIGGTGSKAAVFSFYANKTITTGEGGMIVTNDSDLAKRCRTMRLHGIDRDAFDRFTSKSSQWRYDVVAPGFKYNLTDIAAAIGREQLKFAEDKRVKREAIAMAYTDAMADLPLQLPPQSSVDDVHSWHLYPVCLLDDAPVVRDAFADRLTERGIGYSVHYTPLHRMTYWKETYGLADADFLLSSWHGDRTISLPLFADMSQAEVDEVVAVVREILG